MSRKLSRFENIELNRPRRPDEPKPSGQEPGRFDAVEAPVAESPAPRPTVGLERFQEPGEAPLELAERRSALDQFTRCVRCEADNDVTNARCCRCGADFDTPEQRVFTEQYRAQREEELRIEAEAVQAQQARKLAARPEPRGQVRFVLPEEWTRWWPRHKAPGMPHDGEPVAWEWILARAAAGVMLGAAVVSLFRARHGHLTMPILAIALAAGLLYWTRKPW